MVTKDIYPEVAKQLNKNPRTISRSVERLVLCCWEEGNRAYLAKIIGRNLTTLREPQGNAVLSLRLFSLECPVFHRCPGAALPVVLRYNPFYCNGKLDKNGNPFSPFSSSFRSFPSNFPCLSQVFPMKKALEPVVQGLLFSCAVLHASTRCCVKRRIPRSSGTAPIPGGREGSPSGSGGPSGE